ncbi:hypothetical protein DPMN_166748 [Dreissena polymorpha]|uniref:Uncharacterized protein n=1 Tax=Dreissena polymorpha TaxID=45954 RepID=A0A9D4IXW4_DREPO|nr:hypothetical protein DPMN_166748 [Dreissena polymorpha]
MTDEFLDVLINAMENMKKSDDGTLELKLKPTRKMATMSSRRSSTVSPLTTTQRASRAGALTVCSMLSCTQIGPLPSSI